MSYQALYRVWRPQTFKDVVGQKTITTTLKNAIMTGQTSHAYLFTGPRGTGKTSAAKIFAKAINCHYQKDGEPCNECETCVAITNGQLNDVIEIDAASNNGVEEIRDIREKVNYAPTQADYKVYIIDEVHMLSTGAFNALLKTLEEPPANVVFILATTEPHKIPLTIISRTQRFDFKRITANDIMNHLKDILNEKAITYDDSALAVIANAAEGGMRDALSILDQVLSFGNNHVDEKTALTVTGTLSRTQLAKYLQAMANQDTAGALKLTSEILAEGKSPNRLIEDLISFCRDILLYQQAPALLADTQGEQEIKLLAEKLSAAQLYQGVEVLNDVSQQIRFTNHPEVYLEVASVKLTQPQIQIDKPQATDTEVAAVASSEVQILKEQVAQLQTEIQKLASQPKAKPAKPTRKKVGKKRPLAPTNKIYPILDEATRESLSSFKEVWPDLLNMLEVPDRSIMKASEPVAASSKGVIVTFNYDILYEKAVNDANLIEKLNQGLQRLMGQSPEIICITAEDWPVIRQGYIDANRQRIHIGNDQKVSETVEEAKSESKKEEQPDIVAQAKALFGDTAVKVVKD